MKHIGFTGARTEPTEAQTLWLSRQLTMAALGGNAVFHHGDCVGSDAMAHHIAANYGLPIVVHPPSDDKLRAFCTEGRRVEIKKPWPYQVRNRHIVLASELMLALPSGTEGDQPRSGTWATIRYAVRNKVPVRICYPDGSGSSRWISRWIWDDGV